MNAITGKLLKHLETGIGHARLTCLQEPERTVVLWQNGTKFEAEESNQLPHRKAASDKKPGSRFPQATITQDAKALVVFCLRILLYCLIPI